LVDDFFQHALAVALQLRCIPVGCQ
jgi:hypothetical protein